MFFASDNGAPVVPEVMAALMRANDGPMMPYGDDPVTGAAVAAIRELFEAPRAEAAPERCTVRTRRGSEVVMIEIPCTN